MEYKEIRSIAFGENKESVCRSALYDLLSDLHGCARDVLDDIYGSASLDYIRREVIALEKSQGITP